MKMKTTAAVLATVALACGVRSQAAGLDLGGGRLKGRPPQTLIACGGGSVWLLAPDGRVTWRKDGCGNIHRAVRRGDKVYWSNGNVWVTDIPSRKTELFYSPAKSNGTYGFWITDAGTMVVSENATDYITELKLGSKEVVTRFKGDPRGIDGKMPGAHHHYRMVQKTAAGTYLVCCSGANVVREYDAAGKLVWEQPTPALAFEAFRRANGNTLVSHLGAITEYTPDHRAVWSFTCSDAPELKLANLCGIHERSNGNLVVGTYANGVEDGSRTTAFEVTRDGKVVWSYAPAGRRLSTMTVLPAEESAATDRMAASYHSYEFADVAWTPPPEGFRPFYVSHYGRHGSRRINALGGLHGDWLLKLLQDAEKDGNLTPLGRELLADIARFDRASAGFQGELTQRGVDEHRTLARRMAARTPEVFAPGRRVECCATRSPRCLLSMANFTLALSTVAPGLDISYATGEKIHKMLTGLAFADQKAVKRRKAFGNRLYARSVDSARLLKSLFADPSKVKPGDTPYEFMQKLYVCASDCQCLVREIGELDLWRYFTKDELAALFRCVSAMEYVVLGNSKEFRGEAAREAASAVRDIVERADRAIADPSVAADLRFGHDSGIWPVAGLLDLVGPGDSCPMEEAWEKCPSWKYMSMASNLQMVFFRNAGGKVLVKILWNEKETLVRGPKPVSGPYYDWGDIKFHIAKATGDRAVDAPPDVCVPSPAHLAYQGREIMALVCWGLNPYTNQEWGFGNVPTSRGVPLAVGPQPGGLRDARVHRLLLRPVERGSRQLRRDLRDLARRRKRRDGLVRRRERREGRAARDPQGLLPEAAPPCAPAREASARRRVRRRRRLVEQVVRKRKRLEPGDVVVSAQGRGRPRALDAVGGGLPAAARVVLARERTAEVARQARQGVLRDRGARRGDGHRDRARHRGARVRGGRAAPGGVRRVGEGVQRDERGGRRKGFRAEGRQPSRRRDRASRARPVRLRGLQGGHRGRTARQGVPCGRA